MKEYDWTKKMNPSECEKKGQSNKNRNCSSMKLKITEGCICDSFTADGKDINLISGQELKDILKAVVAKITDTKYEDENKVSHLQTILRDIVSLFYDEYESDDEPCDCCGDFVETFKMEIFL